MIRIGDALTTLRTLPDASVHCCITSPPYWGLRDYGVEGQLGLERTPSEYVANMVAVFREVRRVLRDDGTLWLNLGDSYASTGRSDRKESPGVGATQEMAAPGRSIKWAAGGGHNFSWTIPSFGIQIKPKDLVGIPWRVAFALQADGWYLRQDLIWSKPNPMPESVTDRCTKAHEYLFLLSKSARYWYDAEAVKEPGKDWGTRERKEGSAYVDGTPGRSKQSGGKNCDFSNGRNRRSVWHIATQPCKEAHFAVMPEALVEPCVLAGCPVRGTVLDPFGGAGTVGLVATKLSRRFVLIELNPAYAAIAERRIAPALAQGAFL